jgi:hypothetical protein
MHILKPGRHPKLRSRAGVVEIIETLLAMPVIIALAMTLVAIGRVQYVRLALEEIVGAGARFASTSLSGERGCAQARAAMDEARQNYVLAPSLLTMQVSAINNWGRGRQARVTATYNITFEGIPMIRWTYQGQMRTELIVPVDTYTNRYDQGWTQCTLSGATRPPKPDLEEQRPNRKPPPQERTTP